jgi:hypothetical protein
MDDEKKPDKATQISRPLDPDRVFRPGSKGAWHLQAQTEYGVLWSWCGIRAKAKECQRPAEAIQIRDLCGTCARVAKEEIGKARPSAEEPSR